MDLKGKKLLILAGQGVHCKVVRAAKEMGVYTVVADYLDVADSPAKQIADENVNISILDVDALVEYCIKNKIDGVLNFCNDPAQRPYQQICEKLSLPCYTTAEQVQLLTNKQKFKELCIANGVDVIPTYLEEDVVNGTVDYPVIVKPVDSRGSRGVTLCYDLDVALSAIELAKEASSNGKIIIEKYMGGKQDFQITYLFVDGIPHLIRTADRYEGKVADGMNKVSTLTVSPSKYTRLFLNNIYERLTKMLVGIGIKNGPVFMQGFVDGDTVRFYDPGVRFPGANFENIMLKSNGIDIAKHMIEFALTGSLANCDGKSLDELCGLHGRRAAMVYPMVRHGKIGQVDLPSWLNNTDIASYSLKYQIGDTVEKTGTVTQRFGEFDILSASTEELKTTIKSLYRDLQVSDEKGESMVISKIDLDATDI